jgi:hypothetical protein
MAPAFFFSYARDDEDDDLKAFYTDLAREVRSRLGVSPDDVDFKDVVKIRLGTRWSDELGEWLQKAETLVFVSTPTSHRSDWCGKEWAYFKNRLERFWKAKQRKDAKYKRPPLMIPVVWVPDPAIPKELTDLELSNVKTLDRLYFEKGLRTLHALEPAAYTTVLFALADAVSGACRDHHLLPAPAAPDFDALASPFPPQPAARPSAYFVFLVGRPLEMQGCGRTDLAAYGEGDPPQWRPYFPVDDARALDLAWDAAAAEDFVYETRSARERDLDSLVATTRSGAAVCLIDPWSLKVKELGDYLGKWYAKVASPRAFVAAWDPRGRIPEGDRVDLRKRLERVLGSPDELTADSPERLLEVLQRELIRCRRELLQNSPPAPEVANGQANPRKLPGLNANRTA